MTGKFEVVRYFYPKIRKYFKVNTLQRSRSEDQKSGSQSDVTYRR